jgi:hypothetical protein
MDEEKKMQHYARVAAALTLLLCLSAPVPARLGSEGGAGREGPPGAAVRVHAAECEPTRSDMLGPFYRPGAPERSKVGEGYVLEGKVRSAADCAPVPGARVELWLAGPDGRYADRYRATIHSNSDGGYRFESHYPPPYAGRPSHIHIRVTAQGFAELVTQHYPAPGETGGVMDLVLAP